MELTKVEGGVTFPAGFLAAGVHCGLRKNKTRRDIALIAGKHLCVTAGMFTQNKACAAPVTVTKQHIANGYARAIICNSRNANACNSDGLEKAEATCKALADKLGIEPEDVVVSSTGVIGIPLPLEPIMNGIPMLCSELDSTPEASEAAATAIMTTDTKKKEFAIKYTSGDGHEIRLGGICKGSGMIHPNMATMLGFITTDVKITPNMLNKALHHAVGITFNMVSVDGDTSTNDMVIVLASGDAENVEIASDGEEFESFKAALTELCRTMAKAIASDGEGATKLLECNVSGAKTEESAKVLAKSVISSSLVKTAMFGADANWGRVICALGYSGEDIDVDKIDIKFRSRAGEVPVCVNGRGLAFDEDKAKEVLSRKHLFIDIDMKDGDAVATAWGCDLSYEYVRINGDYRS